MVPIPGLRMGVTIAATYYIEVSARFISHLNNLDAQVFGHGGTGKYGKS
jgi:hypothetical protein